MNILIIDDNSDMTNMLSKYFTLKGYKCSSVNDGKEGLDLLLTQKFNVVLLDLAMPNFSGLDVVSELQRSNKIQDMNIIILTASSCTPDQENRLITSGISAILKKPIDPDMLLEYIIKHNKDGRD